MMKWLNSCGVKNVNVLVDGHYYSELMQRATGDEMTFSTGYSLYPIFRSGIFHPKVLMVFGEKEGLLIVGSGNLTNSGNGNNDEIWGAYHFDVNFPQNAPLFSSTWKYISQITTNIKGIIAEKITNWIPKHAQWLNELPEVEEFQFTDLLGDEKVAFLYNREHSTIWRQVRQLIGNERIVEIVAVSPYYDRYGNALEMIRKAFPDAQFNVILDESGVIPTSLPDDKCYSFYDWKDMNISRNIGIKQHSKLHAKILWFKTNETTEYCLFGSANITAAGLGTLNSANEEVSIFVKSGQRSLLEDIGIKVKKSDEKVLSEFSANNENSIENEIVRNNTFPVKLLAAEIRYSGLTIYSKEATDGPVSIVMYDCNNIRCHEHFVELLNADHEIELNIDVNKLRYIQIETINRDVLSNKIIVSDCILITKTHPNIQNADFEKLCIELNSGELSKVFDLIHYAIIDESEKGDGSSILYSGKGAKDRNAEKRQADPRQLYNLSSYKPIEAYPQESVLLFSYALRVLDALKQGNPHNPELQIDIREDEQVENLSGLGGSEEKEVRREKSISLKILESSRRKLRRFFGDLYKYFHYDILFKENRLFEYKLTLTDLTKYLIALELINEFGGKSEMAVSEQRQLLFTYLPATGDYENDNVKGCCLNIVGDFLRIAQNGFKEYTFEYTKKKFGQLQHQALVNTIVCIINVDWNDDEKSYFKTLILNTLHYLGWRSTVELDENLDTLILEVRDKVGQLKHHSGNIAYQLNYFVNRVCIAFRQSTYKRENKRFVSRANKGQIVYSGFAKAGYCYIVSVNNENEYCLARPGFERHGDEYISHFGDAVYRPLRLPHLTVVDL